MLYKFIYELILRLHSYSKLYYGESTRIKYKFYLNVTNLTEFTF